MNQTISAYRSSDNASISTDYSVWALSGGPASFNGVVFGGIWIFLSSVSGATSITWKITRDLVGDEALTPEQETDIVLGQTTATDGSVSNALGIPIPRMSGWTGTSIYLWVKSDAGTATGSSAHVSYVANTY